MVRIRRIAFVALCLLSACRKQAVEEPVGASEGPRVKQAAQVQTESLYDAQGRLKSSGQRVEWLEIPVGFKRLEQNYPRHTLFQAPDVPLDKARDFFAARMFTGAVEEDVRRVTYRAVMPIQADDRLVRLDVTLSVVHAIPDEKAGIAAGTESLQLDIERLTYDGAQPLTVEQARKALATEQSRAE